MSKLYSILVRLQLGPLLALAFIIAIFFAIDYFVGSGNFLTPYNVRFMASTASMVIVPALGMTMIIIAGGIDLSAGTALTLAGTVLATKLKVAPVTIDDPGFIYVMLSALLWTLATGCICGLINGALISLTNVVPFIVTLGTMSIFLGIGQIIAQESTVYPPTEHIPDWLSNLCYTGSNADKYAVVPYVPTSVLLAIVLAVIVGFLLRFTIFGRNIFALGSSESTARLCGINVPMMIVTVYTLAGLLVAIGGLLNFADIKNGSPTEGQGLELEIIAAVVLGGGSLSGGRGTVLGTVIGALIIVVIRNGCGLLQIPNTYTYIIIGGIIIIAVIVDQLRHGSPEWLFRYLRRVAN